MFIQLNNSFNILLLSIEDREQRKQKTSDNKVVRTEEIYVSNEALALIVRRLSNS